VGTSAVPQVMQYRACKALLAPHRGQVIADILMVT
jgi:hypothetical protein